MCITNSTITPQLQSPFFGKHQCQLAAKIFNCPAFICFSKPLFKERKRGSFVNWNTLHAKRSTRCCNTWPFSIIVAAWNAAFRAGWVESFLSPSLWWTKRILYIFSVGLALFHLKEISPGLPAIYHHFNNIIGAERKGPNHKISQFNLLTIDSELSSPPPKS